MKYALIALLLTGCATPPKLVQLCAMQALGQNEQGVMVVRMACQEEK